MHACMHTYIHTYIHTAKFDDTGRKTHPLTARSLEASILQHVEVARFKSQLKMGVLEAGWFGVCK